MFQRAKGKAKQALADAKKEVAKQKAEFGMDENGAKDTESAHKRYAEERRKDRVKKGKEEDIQDMAWDTVRFVDRYGEEHYVSEAMAEQMQLAEEEAMLDLEELGKLPVCVLFIVVVYYFLCRCVVPFGQLTLFLFLLLC